MSTCRARNIWVLSAFFAALSVNPVASPLHGDSLALENRRISGASVHVITADLNDRRIRIDIGLPAKGLSHSESFAKMIKRRGPLAAVTGTYFDTRSLLPVGTIIIGGRVAHVNCIGTTVGFLPTNRVTFVGTVKGERCELPGIDCGLRTGPRLLAAGQYALNPKREGFRHRGLFGERTRVAMGVTQHNKLLLVLVRTPVTFGRLAGIMKTLGALEAVCLDGGSSAAMYYRGKLVCAPRRALTNIIEIHRSPLYAESTRHGAVEAAAVRTAEPASVTVMRETKTRAQPQLIAQAGSEMPPKVNPPEPERFSIRPEPYFSRLSEESIVIPPFPGQMSFRVRSHSALRGRPCARTSA